MRMFSLGVLLESSLSTMALIKPRHSRTIFFSVRMVLKSEMEKKELFEICIVLRVRIIEEIKGKANFSISEDLFISINK